MIKSNVIISLIIIGLGMNWLGGCNANYSGTKLSVDASSPDTEQPQFTKSSEYLKKWDELDTALQNYQLSVESFIEKLTAINDSNAFTLNTQDAKEKIEKVNKAVVALENASNISKTNQDNIKQVSEKLQALIVDISDKILVPAENGLTTGMKQLYKQEKEGSIAIIQGNLKLNPPDGSIGSQPETNTKIQIKNALTSNLTALQQEIQKLTPSNISVVAANPALGNETIQKQIDEINRNITALQTIQNNQVNVNNEISGRLNILEKNLNKRRIGDIASGFFGGLALAVLLGLSGFAIYNRLRKSRRNGRKDNQNTRNQRFSLTPNQLIDLDKLYDLEDQFKCQVNDDKERDKKINKLYQNIHYLIEENSKLQQQVKNLRNKLTSPDSISISHVPPLPPRQGGIPVPQFSRNYAETEIQSQIQLSPEAELVTYWNSNPKVLSQYVIAEVNEIKDSMNARYAGYQEPTIVEKVARNQGNYWIIQWTDNHPYLVPKDTIGVNEYNFETISALFVPYGYHQDYQTITLKKPALVLAIAGEQWKLEEPGELQFD